MRNGPDAVKLLEIISHSLREKVAPLVPEAGRYELMLINAALGIAVRELMSADEPLLKARSTLSKLVSEPETSSADRGGIAAAVDELTHVLAERIRAGKLDGDPATYAGLLDLSESALAESNPKVLGAKVAEGADGEN